MVENRSAGQTEGSVGEALSKSRVSIDCRYPLRSCSKKRRVWQCFETPEKRLSVPAIDVAQNESSARAQDTMFGACSLSASNWTKLTQPSIDVVAIPVVDAQKPSSSGSNGGDIVVLIDLRL